MKQLLKNLIGRWQSRALGTQITLAVSLVLFAMPALSQPAMHTLKGHVPSVVQRLKPIKELDPARSMRLAIGLPIHNREALTNLLEQMYDPASPSYQQYLTPEQFTQMFGPSEAEYQSVIAFAKANGLSVSQTHPNRMVLDVIGSAADIQKALHVKLQEFQHPTENRTFFAPDTEPSVPAGIPVLDVTGLSNYRMPRPKLHISPNANTPVPNAGTGPLGNYIGNDFRNAYAPDVSLKGTGQVVGLLQFDGYLESDIIQYEQMAGLPPVTLSNVFLNGYDGTPGFGIGQLEVSLDIEMVISMAPGLSKIMLYEAGPFGFPNSIISRMATDGEAKQISCSWGWRSFDTPTSTTDQLFQQLAIQGQTFFNASGDSDAFLPGEVDDPQNTTSPSSSPWIVQVGGTTLTTGAGGAWASETVWNWGGGIGSSGGISSLYDIPFWQQGISMTANLGSTTKRNIPDVALTGDGVFVVSWGGISIPGVGGTSCAAPLWAGFMALVNQQAASLGRPSLGYINPLLYSIGKSLGYNSAFHDIQTGDNTSPFSPDQFFAVRGYDLCTGWGTPRGQGLINTMLALRPSGLLQATVSPFSGSALIASLNQTVFVTVNDVLAITNATVTATIPGLPDITFLNNGSSPDVTPNDGVYSATFQAPATTGPITMTVRCTAPGKTGVTNTVNYTVISVPQNNDFAAATKVPVAGATYLSNNKFATIEANEPKHANVTNVAASLWWDWTPSASTNVFVDTTGSAIDTVLAVYTGTGFGSLTTIAATNDIGVIKQPYLNFNAVAGTAYHIAVASINAAGTGSLRLSVVPGGRVDTNPPSLLVTAPLSGLWVTNNLIAFSGTATDPQPNPSGVRQVQITVSSGQGSSPLTWQFIADGTTNWSSLAALAAGLNRIKVVAQDWAGNVSPAVNVQVTVFSQGPANDLFANTIALVGNSGSVSAASTNATRESGEPDHAGAPSSKSLWWSFTPATDGVLTLDTIGSSFDTVMSLYLGANVSRLTLVAENDDAGPFIMPSLISQAVRSNQVYHIAVDGFGGASGNVVLSYNFTPATVHQLTIAPSTGGSVLVTTTNSQGGVSVMPGVSGDFADNTPISLTGVPDQFNQFGSWSGGIVSSNNPLSILIQSNLDMAAEFVSFPFTDGFESGDLSHLPWTTAGSAPWFVQPVTVAAGQFAARSGVIQDNQSSSLMLLPNCLAGMGSFDYRLSSETNFDLLSFYVDGVLLGNWSGNVPWATFTFPLTAASHVLEWRYTKDPSISAGLDAAFIDNVNLPLAPPSGQPTVAHLQLSRQVSGGLSLDLQGQANQQYILQETTDLVHWVNVSTNTAVGGMVHLPVPSSTNQAEFYRAKLIQ